MFWFFCHKACANLSAQPGIKPTPPALEGKIPTPRLLGKSPPIILKRLWGGAGSFSGLPRVRQAGAAQRPLTQSQAEAAPPISEADEILVPIQKNTVLPTYLLSL